MFLQPMLKKTWERLSLNSKGEIKNQRGDQKKPFPVFAKNYLTRLNPFTHNL